MNKALQKRKQEIVVRTNVTSVPQCMMYRNQYFNRILSYSVLLFLPQYENGSTFTTTTTTIRGRSLPPML